MTCASAAHPRSRGENAGDDGCSGGDGGSSPLARGKRRRPPVHWRAVRLIPARAGKTSPWNPSNTRVSAHPRSRGENASRGAMRSLIGGSSPLARGKLKSVSIGTKWHGLIPARAGKTPPHRPTGPRSSAHPRSRGENYGDEGDPENRRGSSPLARGKPHRLPSRRGKGRLIPARAGKTASKPASAPPRPAHPRSRGENSELLSVIRSRKGSSPLARGKQTLAWAGTARIGLIPARAGKTGHPTARRLSVPAHPRSRGENCCGQDAPASPTGSSPLARGKLPASATSLRTIRLIPARAGKTARGRLAWRA